MQPFSSISVDMAIQVSFSSSSSKHHYFITTTFLLHYYSATTLLQRVSSLEIRAHPEPLTTLLLHFTTLLLY